eukprot:m.210097 g.210097  ORF g.210097 m.210097 type:complete len:904 (-) comp33062_c0_seq1:61-2772(-)
MKEMRGLQKFIAEIRECKSMEKEGIRINKELANIRKNFGKDAKKITGYDRKKYVSKLIFIFLLGNEVEFGHFEAIELLDSPKFSEKQIGYLFVSVLLTDNHEMVNEVAECINKHLRSTKELEVCLALNCIANIGGVNLAGKVVNMVKRLLTSKEAPPMVKKKAALALLRVVRYDPTIVIDESTSASIIGMLAGSDLGVTTAVASLILGLAVINPDQFKDCVRTIITRMHRLLLDGTKEPAEYIYYDIPAPWLNVKLLRILQIFPKPTDAAMAERLDTCLNHIITRAEANTTGGAKKRPRPNHNNANHSVFFEATNLIVAYDNDESLQLRATKLIGSFLEESHQNLRFLALEGLASLSQTQYARLEVAKHLETVLTALKVEEDPTVQRRAVDVLYGICDEENVQAIVKALLNFLRNADYSIREELVLKVAILAEKYASDFSWYVKVVLTLISLAGDHVTEEVWHRVIQIVINREEVQDFSARVCFQSLLDLSSHEAMVKVGAYVLGEFGHLIANDPLCVPEKQLEVLQSHYPMVSEPTRCLIISTYVKFANLFPELKETILAIFRADSLAKNSYTEIQQRAVEYTSLLTLGNADVINKVLDEIPAFPDRDSSMMARLEKGKDNVAENLKKGAKRGTATSNSVTATEPVASSPGGDDGGDDAPTSETTVNNDAFFDKFWSTDSGVLYENPILQIGCKCEFTGNRGKVQIFYGNRGTDSFTNIETSFVPFDQEAALGLHAGECGTTFEAGSQEQQLLQFNCVNPFSGFPTFETKITYQNRRITIRMKLPVMTHKFLAPLPSPLPAAAFFDKWKQIGGPPREAQSIFALKCSPLDIAKQLTGFKFVPATDIDPNAANFCSIAIMHTSTGQIGALLRVEPDGANVKVTVRTVNEVASKTLLDNITHVL